MFRLRRNHIANLYGYRTIIARFSRDAAAAVTADYASLIRPTELREKTSAVD
jgi:hypothetical protein